MKATLAAVAIAAGALVAVPSPAVADAGHYCGHETHAIADGWREKWVRSDNSGGHHWHLIEVQYKRWYHFWTWKGFEQKWRSC